MNFAPYQDASPEIERALSPPPPNDPRMSKANGVRSPPPRPFSPSPGQSNETPPLTRPNAFAGESYAANTAARRGDRGVDLEAFQTSLPMRLDYEAMLAYLLLPPAGGVFLLLTEHKSDYVRFHAWQSSMLFAVIFIIHLIFAWSTVISWMLFAFDLILIAFLAMHAYRDGKDTHPKAKYSVLTKKQLRLWTTLRSLSSEGLQIRLLTMSEARFRFLFASRQSRSQEHHCLSSRHSLNMFA
jgi:uncharacterized membrane protein